MEEEFTSSDLVRGCLHLALGINIPYSGQWDPDTVPVEEYYASAFVLMELVSREVKSQIAGVTVVTDVSGFGFRHIRYSGNT